MDMTIVDYNYWLYEDFDRLPTYDESQLYEKLDRLPTYNESQRYYKPLPNLPYEPPVIPFEYFESRPKTTIFGKIFNKLLKR
jgi:hypothetical protein